MYRRRRKWLTRKMRSVVSRMRSRSRWTSPRWRRRASRTAWPDPTRKCVKTTSSSDCRTRINSLELRCRRFRTNCVSNSQYQSYTQVLSTGHACASFCESGEFCAFYTYKEDFVQGGIFPPPGPRDYVWDDFVSMSRGLCPGDFVSFLSVQMILLKFTYIFCTMYSYIVRNVKLIR